MARKDFKLLVACENQKFQARVIRGLKDIYTVAGARSTRDLARKLRGTDYDLVIADQRFGGLGARELHQTIVRYTPHAVFVVYSQAERKSVAWTLHRRRAMDYILYTRRLEEFLERVHKVTRWTILQCEVLKLSEKITRLADRIKALSKKIETVY